MRFAKLCFVLFAPLAVTAWAAGDLQAQAQPGANPQPGKATTQKASAPKSAAKAPAEKPAKAAKKPKSSQRPASETSAFQARPVFRRDPFNPLIGRGGSGGGLAVPDRLPPGKAGLIVSSLRVDGLVQGPNGMIAVVSNPTARVYFLREGDQLYNGRVERITMEFVAFHEVGRDAFGKPIERQVVKRLYPSPGEIR